MHVLWYVARTKPGREPYAATALTQRGVEVYLPTLPKQKARSGRRDREPLFPCYLFARLDVDSEQWLAARSAPGVAYFVGPERAPVALPDGFVTALQARIARNDGKGGLPGLRPGERVTITEGPFRYMEAVFDRRLSPSGRSQVLVEILSRLVRVELPEHHLRRVG